MIRAAEEEEEDEDDVADMIEDEDDKKVRGRLTAWGQGGDYGRGGSEIGMLAESG